MSCGHLWPDRAEPWAFHRYSTQYQLVLLGPIQLFYLEPVSPAMRRDDSNAVAVPKNGLVDGSRRNLF